MTVLTSLKTLAKRVEGFKDGDGRRPGVQPYRDPVGLWTIGWGHLLHPDPEVPAPDITLSLDQCEQLLDQDARRALKIMAALVKVRLTEGQAVALGDFVFNLGWNLRGSTLLARLNRGDLSGAADQFPKWVYSKGKKYPGLVTRRAIERDLFVNGLATSLK